MPSLLEVIEKLVCQAQKTWEDEAFQMKIQQARQQLASMVRKNPAGSVAVAILAGFLIGKLTHKRRRI